jgi:hypothetical protein
VLAFIPLQEGAKQFGALRIRYRGPAGLCRLRKEAIETALRQISSHVLGSVDPSLGGWRPMPSFERGCEIHLTPFGVARRPQERVELTEKGVDELGDPLIADAIPAPIECY